MHDTIEDVLHEAFTELTLHGDAYLADFAERLSPGLGRGPVKVLLRLERLGPQRVREIALQVRLDHTTVTRHVDDLARRGLVHRTPDPHDRRGVLVELTPAAVGQLAGLEVERRGRMRDRLEDWTAQDLASFVQLLSRFVRRDDLAAHVDALSTPATERTHP